MRIHMYNLVFVLSALMLVPCLASPEGLTAEPNPAAPGQSVKLVWHFVGDKIILYGGRFGKGTIVTSKLSATDTPRKTTRYAVVVWYHQAVDPKQTPHKNAQVHVRYEVVVTVAKSNAAHLSIYKDPRGWQIGIPAGWRRDSVSLPDPSNNGLVFFQKEEDSVERMAVSFMPAQDGGSEALMKRVRNSTFSNYRQVNFVTETATVYEGMLAAWMVFSGQDEAHPGTTTQSMVLAFVSGGRAYVVSARMQATQYKSRAPAFEKMVRGFMLTGKHAVPPSIPSPRRIDTNPHSMTLE